MSNSKKYAADLKELTTQFYLILERYKKAYPPYAANPNEENTTIYLASKSQLDNIFNDLVLLENNVNSSSGVLSTSSSGLDTNIDKLHKQYSKERHELKKIRDFNLASYPMKRFVFLFFSLFILTTWLCRHNLFFCRNFCLNLFTLVSNFRRF